MNKRPMNRNQHKPGTNNNYSSQNHQLFIKTSSAASLQNQSSQFMFMNASDTKTSAMVMQSFNIYERKLCTPAYQNTTLTQQNRSNQYTAHTTTPPPQPVQSGQCVECSSVTVLMCQRCGDYFCSPACQQKNWPKHRYICFQMPSLVHSSERMHINANANMPALNGYQNRQLPPTGQSTSPATNPFTQHRKWVNNSTSPQPHQQQQHNQQQQQHHQQQQQYQRQNRSTPPRVNQKEPEKSLQKFDFNRATGGVNIGRVEQISIPKSNTAVLITAFRTSNRVFIRSIEKKENEGYCDVIKAINDCGRTAGALKTMPTRNAFAITDFNQDGLYYRVQIVSVKNENEINVVYFDFGNEATKKLSELKEITKECAVLKQYVVPVTLKNVPFIRDSDKLKVYLKSFEDVEAKIIYNEREKDRPQCEFIIYGAEDTLNQKINLFVQKLKLSQSESESAVQKQQPPTAELQQKQTQQEQKSQQQHQEKSTPVPAIQMPPTTQSQSQKARPSQLAKPVMVPPFETVTLPANGINLNVIVVDSSLLLYGYFGCLLAEDKANLQSIQGYLYEYEDNGRAYKPKIEEYCLAKYEGSWYRAKVLSAESAEYFEVVFIDFLNESQVSTKDIRRYPMDLDFPCKTSLCMIDGLPTDLSNEILECLKKKMQPGSELKINEVKGMEDDDTNVVIVKINQVDKWLNDNKLI